ncbi:MAG: hypothetical protein RI894_2206 [Bacteroidota bacterium]|jgi:glycosyltransferase involved in cell wall biosynthesis
MLNGVPLGNDNHVYFAAGAYILKYNYFMQKNALSVAILTYNSQQYLATILGKLTGVADEILLLDSGSTDETMAIGQRFGCVLARRKLDDFKTQRQYALDSCAYDYVLMIDSDEIPNEAFVLHLQTLKKTGFAHAGYTLERHWNVLGKSVASIYPVVNPDFPLRLIDRRCYNFKTCNRVHEEPRGTGSLSKLNGAVQHITFETEAILQQKLHRYTDIAAQDLLDRCKNRSSLKPSISSLKPYISAFAAFGKWFFFKKGWKDGLTGIRLGYYAAQYSFFKYKKAKQILESDFK